MSPGETELVRLRNGSTVTLRPATAADEPALYLFLSGLCLEARRLRFFSGAPNLDHAAHLAAATGADRYGLIAYDDIGAIVGHAAYVRLDAPPDTGSAGGVDSQPRLPARAEVAVEVADHLHGQGLGTILIERLAIVAERRGITRFVAEVLAENRAMLDVFREGFDARVIRHDGPEERVEFLTSGWRLARARFGAAVPTS
ncbi:MAG: N-acetyltransferase family protein [Solirubrobacteraceae bacterium]